jgi:hypothetical protein
VFDISLSQRSVLRSRELLAIFVELGLNPSDPIGGDEVEDLVVPGLAAGGVLRGLGVGGPDGDAGGNAGGEQQAEMLFHGEGRTG